MASARPNTPEKRVLQEVRHLFVELAPRFLVVLGVAVVSPADKHQLNAFVAGVAKRIGRVLCRLRLLDHQSWRGWGCESIHSPCCPELLSLQIT